MRKTSILMTDITGEEWMLLMREKLTMIIRYVRALFDILHYYIR